MSLIKCPECGKQVSSSAKQCVHCGCKFTVCPECGSVFIGEKDICPKCGYQISEKENFEKNEKKSENSGSAFGTDIIAAWESRSGTNKLVMKTIKWVNLILYLLVFVFVIIAIIIISLWDTSTLDAILEIKDIKDKAHGLIIAACVVCGIGAIFDNLGSVYSEVLCGAWLRKNNIDVTPYIKKASGQVEMDVLPQEWDFQSVSSAAYLAAVPNDKSIKITKYVLCCLLAIAAIIFGGIALTQNADEYINHKIYENEFNFHYLMLILAAIFFGLCYIISIIGNKLFDKRKTAWLESIGL